MYKQPTPIEVAHLDALRQAHDWVDVMREHIPPEEKLFNLVELPRTGLAQIQPWPAAGPCLGNPNPAQRRGVASRG